MLFNFLEKSAEISTHSSSLEQFMEESLPYVATILEIMGIVVVVWSAIYAFWEFIQNTFFHKNLNLQLHFASGLATGLEFKMAAEIINTVLIRTTDELLVLGAVILLRAVLSVLIHFEMKENSKHKDK